MRHIVLALSIGAAVTGCSEKGDEAPPPSPTSIESKARPEPAKPEARPAPAKFELPQACRDYGAAIERLKACDKIGETIKKIFIEGYEANSKSKAWSGERAVDPALLARSCQTDVNNILSVVERKCP